MKKYNEEYFSVIETKTGRKIVDCGEWADAIMLLHMDTQNRQIIKNKFLMSPVIDVEIPKVLPTNEIVVVHDVPAEKFDEYWDNLLKPNQIKLPEDQRIPVNAK